MLKVNQVGKPNLLFCRRCEERHAYGNPEYNRHLNVEKRHLKDVLQAKYNV